MSEAREPHHRIVTRWWRFRPHDQGGSIHSIGYFPGVTTLLILARTSAGRSEKLAYDITEVVEVSEVIGGAVLQDVVGELGLTALRELAPQQFTIVGHFRERERFQCLLVICVLNTPAGDLVVSSLT